MFGTKENGVPDPAMLRRARGRATRGCGHVGRSGANGSRVLDVGRGTGCVSRIIADTRDARNHMAISSNPIPATCLGKVMGDVANYTGGDPTVFAPRSKSEIGRAHV